MAKKPEKLTLKDLLESQKEAKIGMSASVLSQLKTAAGFAPETQTITTQTMSKIEKDKIVEELQKINKAININLVDQLGNIAKAIQKSTNAVTSLITGRNPESGKKVEKAKSDATLTESELENEEFKEKELKLFAKIEENTRKDKTKKDGGIFEGLGKWGMLLSAAIGGLIGIIQSKIKAIKFFMDMFLSNSLLSKITKSMSGIGKFFQEVLALSKTKVGGLFLGVTKFIGDSFGKLKSLFSISDTSIIAKTFSGIKNIIGKFVGPFAEAFSVIKSLVGGPVGKVTGLFGNIGKWFGMFAKSISTVAGIVGKLFYPIFIITTIWDTVKGTIEGFSKGGIIGGIKGAITGLVNSLVMGPLELIKDATSWILGAFGFDKAEKFLDSFDLQDMFKKFVDMVFKPVDVIKDMFNKLVMWFKNIEIPGIGFNAFGKSFKAGPWKPFAEDAPTSAPQPQTITPTVAPPSAASVVYAKSSENAVIPTTASAPSNTIVSAPTTISKSTSNSIVRPSLRDEDRSITAYYRSRYST